MCPVREIDKNSSNLTITSFSSEIITVFLYPLFVSFIAGSKAGSLNISDTFSPKIEKEVFARLITECPPLGPGEEFSTKTGFPLKKLQSILVNQSKMFLKKAGKFLLCSGIEII